MGWKDSRQRLVPALRTLEATFGPLWKGLLDVLYPPCCVGCNTRLEAHDAALCHRCVAGLERPSSEEVVGVLAALGPASDAVDGAFALWHFDKGGTLQHVQHALKYSNRPFYGIYLGRLMGRALTREATNPPTVVLPVPLHRTRYYQRGYNQSAMLARGLAEVLGGSVRDDVLVRSRSTRSQTTLSREQRWQNVSGAFAVNGSGAQIAEGVLLVDDVLTTGATTVAAAHALRQAGVGRVVIATLALARF